MGCGVSKKVVDTTDNSKPVEDSKTIDKTATAAGGAAPENGKIVVYLGASQPVHGTHCRMIENLVGKFEYVFFFMLRWRPERFGISADTAMIALKKWADSSLSAEQRSRLHLEVVQHDHLGGSRMKDILGEMGKPALTIDTEVEVCFSRKYEGPDFAERIENEWLPHYKKHLNNVKPNFLPEDQDPGAGTSYGTARFVEFLAKYRSATDCARHSLTRAVEIAKEQGTEIDCADIEKDMDFYKPSFLSQDLWLEYLNALVSGGEQGDNDLNPYGEPIYDSKEKEGLENAFWNDETVLKEIGAMESKFCENQELQEWAQDTKNRVKFWKKHATRKEEKMWLRFCLGQQLGQDWTQVEDKYGELEDSLGVLPITSATKNSLLQRRQSSIDTIGFSASKGPVGSKGVTTSTSKGIATLAETEGGEGKCEACYVIDCGSGHSKLYLFVQLGEDVKEISKRMNFVLTDVLRNLDTETETMHNFFGELSTLMKNLVDKCKTEYMVTKDFSVCPIMLGATGGVRRALESGDVSISNWEKFQIELEKEYSYTRDGNKRKVKSTILTGQEEAYREIVAVRTLKKPMLQRMVKGSKTFAQMRQDAPSSLHSDLDSEDTFQIVGLLSGGGESCQIAWGSGENFRVESIRVSTVEAGKRIMVKDENGVSSWSTKGDGWKWWIDHLAEIKGDWEKIMGGNTRRTTNSVTNGTTVTGNHARINHGNNLLTGLFIGTSLQASSAIQCECAQKYILQPDFVIALKTLIEELIGNEETGKESDRIALMRNDFEEWATKKGIKETWSNRKLIHLLSGTRLLAILENIFDENAIFYCAREFEIVKGHYVEAQWPLGSFLAM